MRTIKKKKTAKIEVTVDWILSNFHHTSQRLKNGTVSIWCNFDSVKWYHLALEGIDYKYEEDYNVKVLTGNPWTYKFIINLEDIKDIAPKFYEYFIK
jgi:hypothetical protein